MPRHTEVSWSAIHRACFDARAQIPAGLLAAKSYVEMMALAQRRPLYAAGQFDRAAIMAAAVSAARLHQRRYGTTWAEALSVTLTATWRAAKLARACAPAAPAPAPVQIGARYSDVDRTYEVQGWTPRRPGLAELRIVAAHHDDFPVGSVLLAPVAAVLAATAQ